MNFEKKKSTIFLNADGKANSEVPGNISAFYVHSDSTDSDSSQWPTEYQKNTENLPAVSACTSAQLVSAAWIRKFPDDIKMSTLQPWHDWLTWHYNWANAAKRRQALASTLQAVPYSPMYNLHFFSQNLKSSTWGYKYCKGMVEMETFPTRQYAVMLCSIDIHCKEVTSAVAMCPRNERADDSKTLAFH